MRIVIAGAGLVGSGLARRLIERRHDVTVIDADREVCERIYSQTGASTVHGSATSISTLEDAEMDRADCAAATMRQDTDNLVFTLLARNMGVKNVLVRMRNPRYEDAYRLAGATRVLNIVELYLNQFSWEIEEPDMQEVTSFAGGKASIVFVHVPDDSRAAGRTIAEIARDADFPQDCVIAAVFRPESGQFIIPRGHVSIEARDRVYLAGQTDVLRRTVRYFGVG
jgi:trk system potassium uptake protein TrkA